MEISDQLAIKCHVTNSNPEIALGIRFWLDGISVYESAHVGGIIEFEHQLSDDDGAHEFAIELFGKQPEHTTIDSNGNIVKDAVLTVSNITVDDIDISQIVQELSEYTHNFNGSGEPVVEKFFGSMGCNGTVKLKFTTPVYLWLLENM